jgi:hypothetical protein
MAVLRNPTGGFKYLRNNKPQETLTAVRSRNNPIMTLANSIRRGVKARSVIDTSYSAPLVDCGSKLMTIIFANIREG